MSDPFLNLPFRPAQILLPKQCDLSLWSVVACDQYTAQPDYWSRVDQRVGQAPSSLRLILPENGLDGPDVRTEIDAINATMERYLSQEVFSCLDNAMIYVERTLHNGSVRRGLVGALDLEQYDYRPGTQTPVRGTEGVVLSRIPPRVAVRKGAPLELPHAMLLCNDPQRTLLEPLSRQTGEMEPLYNFDLMEQGGHLRGWKLTPAQLEQVARVLSALHSATPGMMLAVGDGNHSLATAKECYERQKRLSPPEQWSSLPSRFALIELVNLHDPAVEFRPIHRVVLRTAPDDLLRRLFRFFPDACQGSVPGGHTLRYLRAGEEGEITLPARSPLAAEVLQEFLDDYLARHPGRTEYIHGEDIARELAERPGNMTFLLPAMDKTALFSTVDERGLLPRKTFSMGDAHDKRFYLEARKIK